MTALALAAFAAAALAGTGVGGGGLLVIYLTAVAGIPQVRAQAMNLIFFLSASAAALPYHVKHRALNGRLILFAAVLGAVGTLLGGALRGVLSESLLRRIFGVFLVVTGGRSLLKIKGKKPKNQPKNR